MLIFSLARFASSKLWKLVNLRTFCAKKLFKDFICFICRIREVHFSELVKGICHLLAVRRQIGCKTAVFWSVKNWIWSGKSQWKVKEFCFCMRVATLTLMTEFSICTSKPFKTVKFLCCRKSGNEKKIISYNTAYGSVLVNDQVMVENDAKAACKEGDHVRIALDFCDVSSHVRYKQVGVFCICCKDSFVYAIGVFYICCKESFCICCKVSFCICCQASFVYATRILLYMLHGVFYICRQESFVYAARSLLYMPQRVFCICHQESFFICCKESFYIYCKESLCMLQWSFCICCKESFLYMLQGLF